MKKIKIGNRDGCDVFIERTGYYHNEKDQAFEIYAEKFCETPTGARFWNDEIPIIVKDMPEEWAWDVDTSIPPEKRFTPEQQEKAKIKKVVHEATEEYTEMLAEYVQGFEHFDIFLDDYLTQKFTNHG